CLALRKKSPFYNKAGCSKQSYCDASSKNCLIVSESFEYLSLIISATSLNESSCSNSSTLTPNSINCSKFSSSLFIDSSIPQSTAFSIASLTIVSSSSVKLFNVCSPITITAGNVI